AAADAAYTGAHRLQNQVGVDGSNESVKLGLVAGQFDDVGGLGDVDDARAEDLHHALHFLAILAGRAYLDQHQFALDVSGLGNVDDLDDFDELVQLLGDLLDDVVRAGRDDGHARHRRVFGRGDGERFDVVTAGREQARDARQGAGFVLDQ